MDSTVKVVEAGDTLDRFRSSAEANDDAAEKPLVFGSGSRAELAVAVEDGSAGFLKRPIADALFCSGRLLTVFEPYLDAVGSPEGEGAEIRDWPGVGKAL